MLGSLLDKLKKALLEKWTGRLVVLALAAASGYLLKWGISPEAVTNWVTATKEILLELAPIVLAWLISMARRKVALNTMPPKLIGQINPKP